MTENYRHNLHEAHIIIVVGAGCRLSASRRFFTNVQNDMPPLPQFLVKVVRETRINPETQFLIRVVRETLISPETQFLVRVVQMCR